MNQVLQFLLVFLVSAPSTTATTHYVLADDGDDCPTGNVCHPLSYYTSHSDSYFTNNTVFHFMEGNHYMNEGVVIQGKSNITINGSGISSSIITCTNSYTGGFDIHECISITISHLLINNCGMEQRHYSDFEDCVSSILIYNTSNINLHSLSVTHTNDIVYYDSGALMIVNGMGMSITDSSFSSHQTTVTIFYTPFAPHTISEPVNVNLVNCDIQANLSVGLYFKVVHGESYLLEVSLYKITVQNSGVNIFLAFSDSNFLINFEKLASFNAVVGLQLHGYQLDSSRVTALPLSIIITDSDIYNNVRGIELELYQAYTTEQSITLHSCRIYNNYGSGFVIDRRYPTDNTKVHIKDTVIYSNSQNVIKNYDRLTFTNVSIYGTTSTGLTLKDSVIHIEGSTAIFNNSGTDGGGIALHGRSVLVITPNTKLHIYGNTASYRGGGIFSLPADLMSCHITRSGSKQPNMSVNISDNTAVIGNDIYGFDARKCDNKIYFNPNIQQVSYPVKFCFCNETIHSISQCVSELPYQNVFLGQYINFGVAIFGYDYNGNYTITDGTIKMGIYEKPSTALFHIVHFENCSYVSYQMVHEYSHSDVFYIQVVHILYPGVIKYFFYILPCPIGFTLSSSGYMCDCSSVFEGVNVTCNITTLHLSRTGLVWIGTNTSSHDVTTSNYGQLCLIKEPQCFLCNNSNVTFTLNDTEYHQCNYNRSGVLCGQCRVNYSLLLGSNRCELCNHKYNLTLIILFSALGIILVAFLLLLNFTVSQGSLNGIFFFGNVVQLYQPILSREGAYPFFNQVLSWFNLDFGVEMCFFDGMDNYSKTWLQYAFPLYLWFIVGILMVVSQRSSRVAKLNLIPVLSTLFLLSYTKIVRTVVDGLHIRFVTLHCENETSSAFVWYIDPNLPYAQGKHAWLFGFSLIMLVLFCIPYTLFLLFSPVLESYCQNCRCCHFLYKFKPMFDAYNGQVKDNYRFWTGLLLVARLPPLFAIAFGDPIDNNFRLILLFLLLTIVIVLLLQNIWLKGVYESLFINLQESWFLFKLIIIAVIMIFIHNDGISKIIFTSSIGIFFISFVIILFHHLHLKLLKISCYKSIMDKISYKRWNRNNTISNSSSNNRRGPHGGSKGVKVPRTSYSIHRYDSLVELFDPPNDDDYYIENNHSY